MGQTPQKPKRQEFRNIAVTDIKNYRLPLPGIVSILHRISGAAMFLALPFLFCLITASFGGKEAFTALAQCLSNPLVKIVTLGLTWAVLHHSCAGVRYLLLDLHIGIDKKSIGKTAASVLVTSLILTAVVAAKLFGLF